MTQADKSSRPPTAPAFENASLQVSRAGGRRYLFRAASVSTVLLLALLLGVYSAHAQQTSNQAYGAAIPDLSALWPLDAPARQWKVIARVGVGSAPPQMLMWVQNETVGPGKFILWFSHQPEQRPGQRYGELYRLCRLPGRIWLFFDTYIDSVPGRPPIEHQVASDRILFAPSKGAAIDLIRDGLYQACGAMGQPYLLWSGAPQQYRLQIWGHLTENPRFKWYGDSIVTGPESIVDDCMQPVEARTAIRVQEASWSTFKNPSGAWGLGSGPIDPPTGMPTGNGVAYGRTVWHGAGQLPYLMIGPGRSPSNPRWCVNEVTPWQRN